MHRFAEWLSSTALSLAISTHEWVVPAIQSIHILAIGIVLASVLMIALRILGWGGRDQTLTQTTARFGPWLWWALGVLLVTGATMIVGEPTRELLAVSFWLKMALIAVGTAASLIFRRSLRRHQDQWEIALAHGSSIQAMAVLTFLTWISVAVLGRLIAYDYIWGRWAGR